MNKAIGISAVLLLHATSSCFGQSYLPLLREGSHWSEIAMFEAYGTYVLSLGGDTIVNSIVYRSINKDGLAFQCDQTFPMREDTAERKVYGVNWMNDEVLVYDFSLQPGEHTTVFAPCLPDTFTVYLDSISNVPPAYVTSTPVDARFFYLTDTIFGTVDHPIWMEGVGSLAGLYYPPFRPIVPDEALLCHGIAGEANDLERIDLDQYADSCYHVYTDGGMGSEEEATSLFSITPNPAHDHLLVRSRSGEALRGVFRILDGTGRTVDVSVNTGTSEMRMDISERSPGSYLIEYSSANGARWVGLIVKQ